MIKLILTIFISFLSVNLGFALDYYDIENSEKYENGKYLTTMYLKDQKNEGKSLEDVINKEFQIVTNKERIIKSKPHYNKVTNRFEFDEKLNKYERGIIAISTNESVKFGSLPRWKRENVDIENDYKIMERIANQYTNEIDKNSQREFKKRYGSHKNTYVRITSGLGYDVSSGNVGWGTASGLGFLKREFDEALKNKINREDYYSKESVYKFKGLFFKNKLVKYFVRLSPTFTDTLSYLGQILIGEKTYIIIYEGQAEDEKADFPYLYLFSKNKLGERVEPIYSVGKKLLD